MQRKLSIAIGIFTAGIAMAQSGGGQFGITHSVIAPAQTSTGGRFGMTATIGQASASPAGAGTYQLIGGFAAANTPSDRIFTNGFEP